MKDRVILWMIIATFAGVMIWMLAALSGARADENDRPVPEVRAIGGVLYVPCSLVKKSLDWARLDSEAKNYPPESETNRANQILKGALDACNGKKKP